MMRESTRQQSGGFTLLELLVVLAIAGLLLAAVPPVISAVVPGVKFRDAALELKHTLRSARSQSIVSGRPVTVFLTPGDPAEYRVGARRAETLPDGVQLAARPSYTRTEPPRAADSEDDEAIAVAFYPDGSSSGGKLTLRQGDRRYDIVVGWLLGDVSVLPGEDHAAE